MPNPMKPSSTPPTEPYSVLERLRLVERDVAVLATKLDTLTWAVRAVVTVLIGVVVTKVIQVL